jgi:peptidoglycan hydrolase CwlO-like protein
MTLVLKGEFMKMIIGLLVLTAFAVHAEIKNPDLSAADQKYYKNEAFDGSNQRERIDMNVREINKLMGEIASMKAEIQQLKKDVEDLKKK